MDDRKPSQAAYNRQKAHARARGRALRDLAVRHAEEYDGLLRMYQVKEGLIDVRPRVSAKRV